MDQVKLPKQSFTINEESVTEFDLPNVNVFKIKYFDDTICLSDIFLYKNSLYHKSNGLVYTFKWSKVKEIHTFDSKSWRKVRVQTMSPIVSYYVFKRNELFEFWIHVNYSKNIYIVNIRRSEFTCGGKYIATHDVEKIEFNSPYTPFIFMVDSSVLISLKYKYEIIDDRDLYLIRTLRNEPYGSNTKSIIYNLDKCTHSIIPGIINFNVVSMRFIVVFAGKKFLLIDIKTCKEKMQFDSGLVDDSAGYVVSTVVVPSRIAGRDITYEKNRDYVYAVNEVYTKQKVNGKCKVTRYTITEDREYKPESYECICCYTNIERNYVVIPCGNRQYCGRCAKLSVERGRSCAKCGIEIKQCVKIQS